MEKQKKAGLVWPGPLKPRYVLQWKSAIRLSCSLICKDTWLVGSVHSLCRWREEVDVCRLLGVDKHFVHRTWCCRARGKRFSPWVTLSDAERLKHSRCGDFIFQCTLQQTSLLIRSPWITQGIWTVCSWANWMMPFFCSHGRTLTQTCTRSSFFRLVILLITWI